MSHASELESYRAAIRQLGAIPGVEAPLFIDTSQASTKAMIKKYLRAFTIDPTTKAILTTDQNFALAAKILADLEHELDYSFVKPGQDWITALKQKAYFIGQKYQAELIKGGNVSDAVVMQGVDATTLRILQQQTYGQVTNICDGQVEYLRRTLTSAILNNRTWDVTMDKVIVDGKIPALEVVDKNGVSRFIEMQTRVETLVRTETARVSELGSKDKAREVYGDQELGGRWHTILDGRERESHEKRNAMVRSLKDWEGLPGPDGKIISPGEEPNCRCWMEWGNLEELQGFKPARRPTGQAPPTTVTTKTPKKPPTTVTTPTTKKPAGTQKKAATPGTAKHAAPSGTAAPPYAIRLGEIQKYKRPKETLEAFEKRMARMFNLMSKYFDKHGIVVTASAQSDISPIEMRAFAAWHRNLPKAHIKRFEELGSKFHLTPGMDSIGLDDTVVDRYMAYVNKGSNQAVRNHLLIPHNVKLTRENIRKYAQARYDGTRGLSWARGETGILEGTDIWVGAQTPFQPTLPGLSTTSHEFGHFIDDLHDQVSTGWRWMSLVDQQKTFLMPDQFAGYQSMNIIKVAFDLTGREYGANHIRPGEILAEMMNCFISSKAKNAELLDKWPEMWELCRRLAGADASWYGQTKNSELLFTNLKEGAELWKKKKQTLSLDDVAEAAIEAAKKAEAEAAAAKA